LNFFAIIVVFSFKIASSPSIRPGHFWTAANLTMPLVYMDFNMVDLLFTKKDRSV